MTSQCNLPSDFVSRENRHIYGLASPAKQRQECFFDLRG
jgi:hypothetical protein